MNATQRISLSLVCMSGMLLLAGVPAAAFLLAIVSLAVLVKS